MLFDVMVQATADELRSSDTCLHWVTPRAAPAPGPFIIRDRLF
jgi:hypothetical protein